MDQTAAAREFARARAHLGSRLKCCRCHNVAVFRPFSTKHPLGLLRCDGCAEPACQYCEFSTTIMEKVSLICFQVPANPTRGQIYGYVCCQCGQSWRAVPPAQRESRLRSLIDRCQGPGVVEFPVALDFREQVCATCGHVCCLDNCIRFRLLSTTEEKAKRPIRRAESNGTRSGPLTSNPVHETTTRFSDTRIEPETLVLPERHSPCTDLQSSPIAAEHRDSIRGCNAQLNKLISARDSLNRQDQLAEAYEQTRAQSSCRLHTECQSLVAVPLEACSLQDSPVRSQRLRPVVVRSASRESQTITVMRELSPGEVNDFLIPIRERSLMDAQPTDAEFDSLAPLVQPETLIGTPAPQAVTQSSRMHSQQRLTQRPDSTETTGRTTSVRIVRPLAHPLNLNCACTSGMSQSELYGEDVRTPADIGPLFCFECSRRQRLSDCLWKFSDAEPFDVAHDH